MSGYPHSQWMFVFLYLYEEYHLWNFLQGNALPLNYDYGGISARRYMLDQWKKNFEKKNKIESCQRICRKDWHDWTPMPVEPSSNLPDIQWTCYTWCPAICDAIMKSKMTSELFGRWQLKARGRILEVMRGNSLEYDKQIFWRSWEAIISERYYD